MSGDYEMYESNQPKISYTKKRSRKNKEWLHELIIKIEDFPQIKNIISWNYFLLKQLFFLFYFFSQKKLINPTTP